MSKRFSSFLVGAFAAVLLGVPATAQKLNSNGGRAAFEQMRMTGKISKADALKKQKELSEVWKKVPDLRYNQSLRNNLKDQIPGLMVPNRLAPKSNVSVKNGANLLPAAVAANYLANVTYNPSLSTTADIYFGEFSPSAPNSADIYLQGVYEDVNLDFHNGGALIDDLYYAYVPYYINYWSWFGVMDDFLVFDANTWELVDHQYNVGSDYSLVAAELAYAADGTVYGEFYDATGQNLELATIDYSTLTRTTIGALENYYLALGITSDKVLYGVADDGNLYKIDAATAEETLVGPTGVNVANYYTAGEIDPATNTFYWYGIDQASITKFYTVDLTSGAATAVYDFGEPWQVCAMQFVGPEANDNAPSVVENAAVAVDGSTNQVTVYFFLPTETFAGDPLTGTLNYTVLAKNDKGEEATITGADEAGKAVNVVMDAPFGNVTFTIIAGNAEGNGPKTKIKQWVGNDVPQAPGNATLVLDGNKATVTWDAPVSGVHNGFIGAIAYDVYRFTNNVPELVAQLQPGTTFSETLPDTELSQFYYGIVAWNADQPSAPAYTNRDVYGHAFEVPYYEPFDTDAAMAVYTIINDDDSTPTWGWLNGAATYSYDAYAPADDWLISPPIIMKAGVNYDLKTALGNAGDTYPERVEIYFGTAPTAEAMTNLILGPTDINTRLTDPYVFETEEFQVPADGEYYFGFHAISDANMWRLQVDYLSINFGLLPTAPDAPQLTATAAPEGALLANTTIVAPSKSINGEDLAKNLVKVELLRNGAVVNTVADVAPGATLNYDDAVPAAGVYSYQAIAYDENGHGRKSQIVSVFVGVDAPAFSEDALFTIQDGVENGYIKGEWTAIAGEGQNGGYVNVNDVNYEVYSTVIQNNSLSLNTLDWTGTRTRAFLPYNTTEGDQKYVYYALGARNETGFDGYLVSNSLVVGKPYSLPFVENMSLTHLPAWYVTDNSVSLAYTEESSDGDGQAVLFTPSLPGTFGAYEDGKIDIKGAKNPALIFDYLLGSDANTVTVSISTMDGVQDEYVIDPAEIDDFAIYEWQTATIDLRKYTGWTYIRYRIQFDFNEPAIAAIDNVNVFDYLEYNLAVQDLVVKPSSINAGQKTAIAFDVKNFGQNAAEAYQVIATVDGVEILNELVNDELATLQSKHFTAEYPTSIFDEAGDRTVEVSVIYDEDLNEDDNTLSDVITVNVPNMPTVENLVVYNSTAIWEGPATEAPVEQTEDFEDTDVFPTFGVGGIDAENHYGAYGAWTLYDGNGIGTYGFQNSNIPEPFAVSSFRPYNSVEAGFQENQAHSGSQCLLSTCPAEDGNYPNADHWLISPVLPGIAQTISFYATQLSPVDPSDENYYGLETFEIWVSSTDNKVESFTKIADGQIESIDWAQFSYDLPEGTLYFAIRHTSKDVFGLLIDDVTYKASSTIEVAQYNIYVGENGQFELDGSTKDLKYALADLPATCQVAVTVVYVNGVESAPVVVDVESGISTAIEVIEAAGRPVDVYTIDGILVRSQVTNVDGLKAGIYVINGTKCVVR